MSADYYGVIGNPIHHSLSPRVHSLFAEQTQQQIDYHPILVELDALPQALDDFQSQHGKGLSITLPFKQRAFNLIDSYSDRAGFAKAVNVIQFNKDGSRHGDNTDGIGLVRDIIQNCALPICQKRVLVLGAGGAVRGVLGPLLQAQPSELVVVNRTESKALLLIEEFLPYGPIRTCHLSELVGNQFDIVINATSASLQGEVVDLPKNILNEDAFCYDMVYGKGLTPFLRWAGEQEVRSVDGLGMLVEQAAESFSLWRGVKPETQPVLEALRVNMSVNA